MSIMEIWDWLIKSWLPRNYHFYYIFVLWMCPLFLILRQKHMWKNSVLFMQTGMCWKNIVKLEFTFLLLKKSKNISAVEILVLIRPSSEFTLPSYLPWSIQIYLIFPLLKDFNNNKKPQPSSQIQSIDWWLPEAESGRWAKWVKGVKRYILLVIK